MVEFVKVTTLTPKGDTKEYSWMGSLETSEGQQELTRFMLECCDDTADFFGCPDEDGWDVDKWRNMTCARWEPMESKRQSIGPSESPFMRY